MADDNTALTSDDLDLVEGLDDGGKQDEPSEGGWADNVENPELKTALSKFDTEQEFLDALGFELAGDADDWRADLPEELKATAERFASSADAIRAVEDFRKRASQARVPGKDATDDERAAYLKAVGVPKSPDGYEFPALPEGFELTDEIKASRQEWSKRFHTLGISKDAAKQLSQALNEEGVSQLSLEMEADKAFAKSQEDALRTEWKGKDYDKNVILAGNALTELANRTGQDADDLKHIEMKDGRFLLDRVEILKILAFVGREMGEAMLGPTTLTDSERETADEELRSIRKQAAEAQAEGNSKLANRLYAREQAIIAKTSGNQPIVGSGARTV